MNEVFIKKKQTCIWQGQAHEFGLFTLDFFYRPPSRHSGVLWDDSHGFGLGLGFIKNQSLKNTIVASHVLSVFVLLNTKL